MRTSVYTVSDLVRSLKSKLDLDASLQKIIVQGEISNFTAHRSGHWYFTLKDSGSRISCVMFASYASRCLFKPKEGLKVLIQANTSIFEASGQLQLYVQAMKQDGIGDYYQQFEMLKKKLFEQGYFDIHHKKPLPKYPMKIGIITGKNTAAREDVVTTIHRRWPICELFELNTLVQGNEAALEMIEALKKLDGLNLDVIILARGGGSIEDLWAFNDERLALTIYEAQTPIITGVGHEVDTTIVDYVSDRRAPTPTGAAEMATPELNKVLLDLQSNLTRLQSAVKNQLRLKKNALAHLAQSKTLHEPVRMIEVRKMKLDYLSGRLEKGIQKLSKSKEILNLQKTKLIHWANSELFNQKHDLEMKFSFLNQSMESSFMKKRQKFEKTVQLLDAYSPLKSLARGYSMTLNDHHELITSIEMISIHDQISVQFKDGTITAEVMDKEKNHE